MKKRPHSCNILFGILSVQCVLLPAAAAAQVDPGRQDISALSAAIEEARRSPFHAQVGTVAAFMSLRAIDPDNWPAVFVPAIDAAVTTLVTLALHDLGN